MSPRQGWFLREFVATLRYELEQQDLPSTIHTEGFPEPFPERVYVLVSPREYVELEGAQALPDTEILRRSIFLSAESAEAIGDGVALDVFRHAGAVFDINARAVAALRRAGIPARHLRPGYSRRCDGFDPDAERPIDVVFFGSHSLRRTKVLTGCAPVLARHNCHVQIADPERPNTEDSASYLAESKWTLLGQAKVALNIHRGETTDLELTRVVDAIHAGAVVITEPSVGLSPFVPDEHLLVAGPESLPFVLETVLNDTGRLRRLRTQAYERLRSWLPFALPVSVFRAAVIELVGRPVRPNVALGLMRPPLRAEADSAPPATSDGLQDLAVEVSELRSEIARLEQIVWSQEKPGRARVLYDSLAWAARRAPEITVLMALRDDAARIRASLNSLAKSWPRDFELVLVDDASTDHSAELARDWLRAHPEVPARLVSHAAPLGVGAARNTALDFARGRYCFIFDADNEVYPRCLDVLAWMLDGIHDVTFVYPIVEVYGLTDDVVSAGGDYLLNVYGWEPDRMLNRNLITGLAMVRAERLRELGGFATETHLVGREDHDLWRRMDGRGWRGQLAAQILGRYRASNRSIARASALDKRSSAMSLADRTGRVPVGVATA